jgi:hypothetical protein
MKPDEDQNAQDYSQATLSSFNQARNLAVLSARPPLWLIVCTALLVAIITLTMYYPGDSAMRKVVVIGAVSLYWLTWCIYCYLLRKKGIKVRAFPRDLSGKIFVLGGGIFYILVIIIAAAFLDQGVQSAPWLAALVNGICWAMVTYRYPTGDLTRGWS